MDRIKKYHIKIVEFTPKLLVHTMLSVIIFATIPLFVEFWQLVHMLEKPWSFPVLWVGFFILSFIWVWTFWMYTLVSELRMSKCNSGFGTE